MGMIFFCIYCVFCSYEYHKKFLQIPFRQNFHIIKKLDNSLEITKSIVEKIYSSKRLSHAKIQQCKIELNSALVGFKYKNNDINIDFTTEKDVRIVIEGLQLYVDDVKVQLIQNKEPFLELTKLLNDFNLKYAYLTSK